MSATFVASDEAPVTAHRPRQAVPVVVGIAGGKGGVGTSTAAAILAATMASRGHEVLLVDAADRLGTLDVLLGVTPRQSLDALRGGRADPDDMLVPVSQGLTLLPTTHRGHGAALGAAERHVLFDRLTTLFPRYTLVVFDAGASAASALEACAHGVTRVLAVTGGDRIALAATYALVKLLHERYPAVRVDLLASRVTAAVAAMAHDSINRATMRFLSKGIHLAGLLPDDPDFGAALAAGLGTHEAASGSNAALAMQEVGERLLKEEAPETAPAVHEHSTRKGRIHGV